MINAFACAQKLALAILISLEKPGIKKTENKKRIKKQNGYAQKQYRFESSGKLES